MNADGTITWSGQRGSIHKIGCLCSGAATCNGWIHWLYIDTETGVEQVIDVLRAGDTNK